MEPLHAKDVLTFVEDQGRKETLRFITCGSVDDGKSTLIDRLLFESKMDHGATRSLYGFGYIFQEPQPSHRLQRAEHDALYYP